MSNIITFKDGDHRWVQFEAGRVTITDRAVVVDGLGVEKRQTIATAVLEGDGWHLSLEPEAIRYRVTVREAGEKQGRRLVLDVHPFERPFQSVVVQ